MTSQIEDSQMDADEPVLPSHVVDRAIKCSYAQAMLSSIYVASTGGMFLIGYALKLSANDVQIGLMSTIPMLCVVVQLISSAIIERGASRRRMSIACGLLNVFGWIIIITLPIMMKGFSEEARVTALIGTISLVTIFAYISGNARSSWVGDLIPARKRGTFFGRMTMYAGIIGVVFAIGEGILLDRIKNMGLSAFNWLFLFGILFGLLSTLLFIPQADVPVTKHESSDKYLTLIRETFTNRPLMVVMLYALVWSMQALSGPFYATYLLRDLKMSYLGFGIVSGVATITVLASSPFWGRIIDRYGSKPVLVTCTAFFAPLPLVWIWMTSAKVVYATIIPLNLLGGFAIAGISVALSTLLYKVTPTAGRSVQFAIYSVVILLLVSPMPTIGGHLPGWLKVIGIQADIRCTFYTSILFFAGAALIARRIKEPDASRTSELVTNLPCHLRNPSTLEPEE